VQDGPAAQAAVACDLAAPFAAPERMRELDGFSARLTPDELTVFFERILSVCYQPDAGGCQCDEQGNCCDGPRPCPEGYFLFIATRPTLRSPFGAVAALRGLNIDGVNESPSIDATGLNLYFDVTRAGQPEPSPRTLYIATRSNPHSPFATAVKEPATFAINAAQAFVLPDSSYLYYTAVGQIYRARLVSGNPEAPELVGGLGEGVFSPTPTPDQRTIYFQSKGPDGMRHVFVATRPDAASAFREPHLVQELYLPGIKDSPSWVSGDGCHLYFDRGGANAGIHIARRPVRR
jgi:hypothetical protein